MSSRHRSILAMVVALVVGAACGPGGSTGQPASSFAAPSSGLFPSAAASPSAAPSVRVSQPIGSRPPGSGFDPNAVSISLEPVADIPGAPLAIAAPDDGSGRLFVADREGTIWVVKDGHRGDQPFLDIRNEVTAGGEQGLLGLAFAPGFPKDPRFFIYYTDRDQNQVVAERRVDPANPDRADPAYERLVLHMDDFAPNHNGGNLVFGPDGYLYIGTGDGGGAGDPRKTGQDPKQLLGKILRIEVPPSDKPGDYRPAPNPPFAASGGRPEIWETGLRNPWRFSFDRATGDLWIGDVGQNAWEEIDVDRGNKGGLNYGWSLTEGRHCFGASTCSTEGLTPPVTEYGHGLGCSVTGGVVYRGTQWPALVGAYLFADYCSGRIWAIDAASNDVATPTVVAETNRQISSFGEDAGGEVYATDLNGTLLRLVAPAR